MQLCPPSRYAVILVTKGETTFSAARVTAGCEYRILRWPHLARCDTRVRCLWIEPGARRTVAWLPK